MNAQIHNHIKAHKFVLTTPALMLLYAVPGMGKSHMIKFVIETLYAKKALKYGIVLCADTTKADGSYNYIPSDYVHIEEYERAAKSLINLQNKALKSGPAPPAFIVLDDVTGANFSRPVWLKLFTTFRHLNITILFSVHRIGTVSTTVRDVATHAVIFAQKNYEVLRALWKQYGMSFGKFSEFREYISKHTKNIGDVVIIDTHATPSMLLELEFLPWRAPAKIKEVAMNFD